MDDFTIEEAPSCLEPTNVLASDETTTSATISWTAGGSETEWDIYFTTNSSDVPTASTTPTFSGLTTNSFNTVTNNYTLTPATIYYVYVRAVCSGTETSGWSNPGIFNTECYEMNLPFSYGFEDGGLSVCWTAINESPVYMSVSVASDNAYEGTYHLFLDRRTTQSSNQIVVLPEVSSNYALKNCEVSFYAMLSAGSSYYAYGRTLTVGVMTDPDDVSTFVAVGSAVEPGTSYAQYTFDLSSYTGNGQYIAIKHDATSNGYTYIDNLEVTVNEYTIPIEGYEDAEGKDHYYLIASPVGTVNINEVGHLLDNNFDLYYFAQAGDGQGNEWINYNNGEDTPAFSTLEVGKGYLYANSEDVTLTFSGTANTNGTVGLDTYVSGAYWNGWNLIGNPLAETAYIDRPFYTMNSTSGVLEEQLEGAPIEAMNGVFVIAGENETTITFGTEAPAKSGSLALNLTQGRAFVDRAIVRFDEGRELPKFQLNENNTKVFFKQDNKDYAVVNAEGMGDMPVSFKAEKNGSFTMNVTSDEVSFSYLHLIDNMTGADVDLLANPTYSFNASTTDYESRFRLVFATGSSVADDTFGFINGAGNLSIFGIEGEATLQVMDVNGRVLSTETFSGSIEKHLNVAAGIYMLRLINGDNVKVQKVVVK